MPKPLVPDALWKLIEPLLPEEQPKPKGGRPRVPDRRALEGIIFVLKSGIPWNMLPQEMGCGSPMTCWRRLREWQETGVWDQVFELVLAQLRKQGELDLSRAVVDSASVRSLSGGRKRAPIPRTGPGRGASTT